MLKYNGNISMCLTKKGTFEMYLNERHILNCKQKISKFYVCKKACFDLIWNKGSFLREINTVSSEQNVQVSDFFSNTRFDVNSLFFLQMNKVHLKGDL